MLAGAFRERYIKYQGEYYEKLDVSKLDAEKLKKILNDFSEIQDVPLFPNTPVQPSYDPYPQPKPWDTNPPFNPRLDKYPLNPTITWRWNGSRE